MEQSVIEVRYYNVMVYVHFLKETDLYLVPYLKRLVEREKLTLKTILNWCHVHGLETKTKFTIRKDFPIRANIVNYIIYKKVLRDISRNKE